MGPPTHWREYSPLGTLRSEMTESANELSAPPRKLDLNCSGCGYGVLRSTPPERCPMCQAKNAWILSAARL